MKKLSRLTALFFAPVLSLLFVGSALAFDFETNEETGIYKKYAIESEHFRYEYSDLVRSQSDSDGDGVPNIVEILAEAAEDSYELMTDDLNYDEPADGGVTVVILDDKSEYLIEGSIGTTGVFSNGKTYVAVNPWLNTDLLKLTMAHEFFHVVQFDYDPDFARYLQGVNWAEATAVWVEDFLYDDQNDYVSYLPDFFENVDYSIFATEVPSDTLFTYALNIWPRFLSQYFDDDDIIRRIWENYTDSRISYANPLKIYESVKEVIQEEGEFLDEVFQTFTLWNLAPDEQYEEGELFPEPDFLLGTLSDNYILSNTEFAPASYGTNYLLFENPGEEAFYIHLQKSDQVRMAVTLLPYDDSGLNWSDFEQLIIERSQSLEDYLVLENLDKDEDVVLVVSPLEATLASPEMSFDLGYIYSYQAGFGEAPNFIGADDEDLTVDEKEGDSDVDHGEIRIEDEIRLSIMNYDEDTVFLSWNRISDDDVAGYELRYGTESEDYEFTRTIEQPYTTFATVDGLEEGERYYFQVVALDEDGREEEEPSIEISVIPTEWIFTDLSYTDVHYDAISGLVEVGIFEGYPDGSFQTRQSINRAELLKILVEGQGFTPDPNVYRNCFPDVGREWFAKYVCYAKQQGWVQGYPDNSFRPGNVVNKVEALKMMFEVYAAGLNEGSFTSPLAYTDLDNRAWYAVYVEEASELGLLSERINNEFLPQAGRNRGDMAEILYRYLVSLELL